MSAEEMFYKLGYFKYVCEQTKTISYRKHLREVVFSLENKTFFAEIIGGDLNFPKYRPMEISCDIYQAISRQIEELGWN